MFSFCCWKTGKHSMRERDSGHLLTVSESVVDALRHKSRRSLGWKQPSVFNTTPELLDFVMHCCVLVFQSAIIHPSIHLFMHISQAFVWPNNHKRTQLEVSGVSVSFQISTRRHSCLTQLRLQRLSCTHSYRCVFLQTNCSTPFLHDCDKIQRSSPS